MANVNPRVLQGTLNRVRTSVVIANYPALSITAPYMSRRQAQPAFEGDFVNKIATATGSVNSPEPFVFATLTIGLLRTQALAQAWLDQAAADSYIGTVNAHADSAAFGIITLNNTTIQHIDPGTWDGQDPTVSLVLRGEFWINNNMWVAI